ncbi:MAG: hypothetical protein ABMA13_18245 [Chthoniobacteraceae bacterium]
MYFVTAINPARTEWLCEHIEAEDFEQACGIARVLARTQLGEAFRLTSVVEQTTKPKLTAQLPTGAAA